MRAAVLVGVAAAACGSFEDPSIVLDLRAIAAVAEPPEQVVDVDPMNPTAVSLAPYAVCALVADPLRRPLSWSMSVCPPKRDGRCDDPDAPKVVVTDVTEVDGVDAVHTYACGTVPGGVTLVPVLRQTIEDDSLGGFGGVDLNASIRVVPVGGDEGEAIYLAKALRASVRLPAERVANHNPQLLRIESQLDRGGGLEEPVQVLPGPCGSGNENGVPPGATVKLTPFPTTGSAETYVVPTFEGGSRMFTENLRYQWLATGGDWSRGDTGGPRDPAGNPAVITTQWTAPELDPGEDRRDLDAWVVQRDERGGASWMSWCFAVRR